DVEAEWKRKREEVKPPQLLTPDLIALAKLGDREEILLNGFAMCGLGETIQSLTPAEAKDRNDRLDQIKYQMDYQLELAGKRELLHAHRSAEAQAKIDIFKRQTLRMIEKGTAVSGAVPEPEPQPAPKRKRQKTPQGLIPAGFLNLERLSLSDK